MFDTIFIFMSIRNDISRAVSHVESPKTDQSQTSESETKVLILRSGKTFFTTLRDEFFTFHFSLIVSFLFVFVFFCFVQVSIIALALIKYFKIRPNS